MVLQEFSIHETVSPIGLVSNEFYSPQHISTKIQPKKKFKRKTCPICEKRVKGAQALSQHTRSKHPNSLRKKLQIKAKQTILTTIKGTGPKGVACPTCGVKLRCPRRPAILQRATLARFSERGRRIARHSRNDRR